MLVGHGPTEVHLAEKTCGYFTLSPPLPLHVPSLSPAHSFFPCALHLENKLRQSECNLLLVTARVSPLASLPLSLFLSLFFTSLPLYVYIWSQLQHLCL